MNRHPDEKERKGRRDAPEGARRRHNEVRQGNRQPNDGNPGEKAQKRGRKEHAHALPRKENRRGAAGARDAVKLNAVKPDSPDEDAVRKEINKKIGNACFAEKRGRHRDAHKEHRGRGKAGQKGAADLTPDEPDLHHEKGYREIKRHGDKGKPCHAKKVGELVMGEFRCNRIKEKARNREVDEAADERTSAVVENAPAGREVAEARKNDQNEDVRKRMGEGFKHEESEK